MEMGFGSCWKYIGGLDLGIYGFAFDVEVLEK
jgi:hypothetical protein